MKIFKKVSLVVVFAIAITLGLIGPSDVLAATSPTLSALTGYSVLGGGSITNVPTTTTNGDIGVSPGTSLGGGYAGTGTTHSNDGSAVAAQAEALTTFGTLNQDCDYNEPSGTNLSTLNVGSGAGILPAGVYCSAGSFLLTTTVNLSGSGVWIFKTVSTLITSTVHLLPVAILVMCGGESVALQLSKQRLRL